MINDFEPFQSAPNNVNNEENKEKASDEINDGVERSFLIKMLELNQSAYRRKDETPQEVAKKYGYQFVEDREDVRSGYYAFALKKQEENEILIVHRATLVDATYAMFEGDWSLNNLQKVSYEIKTGLTDDARLTLNGVPKQAFQAISYVNQITSTYKDHKIVQTGHSLGGYLAQVAYLFCDIETHALDCPGAQSSIKKLFPDIEPIRTSPIKYYFTYPPCGVNCDGLRLYPSTEFTYEIVLKQYSTSSKVDTDIVRLSVESFISNSFDQHAQDNTLDNLNMGCVIRQSQTQWPSTPLASYQRYLSIENADYWKDRFENLNLPADKKWQIFQYFKSEYLKPRDDLTYASALLILNVSAKKLIKDFEYHKYINSGGSVLSYYSKKLYEAFIYTEKNKDNLSICQSNDDTEILDTPINGNINELPS